MTSQRRQTGMASTGLLLLKVLSLKGNTIKMGRKVGLKRLIDI